MKKAQAGMNAAILVAVIAGLIVLYIIFLPASEREKILENKTSLRGEDEDEDEDILLQEFPGRIDIVKDVEKKTIPNVFLFETTNAKELERINPFIVRNGWFDKKTKTAAFGISDLQNTDNVLLSFNAKRHDGVLTIELNGEGIYENDIESQVVAPIKLKKSLLQDDNVLDFGVSSVGIKFWKTNEYNLDNIKITGDITDKSRQESRNVFILQGDELFNIEEATLKFIPYCRSAAEVGVLDIFVNNKNIFSAVPVCEDPYRQPIPIGALEAGENRVVFRTSRGSYSVEQIEIEFEEEEIKTNVFFFELNQSQIDEIEEGDKDITLTIEFVEDEDEKRADLNINDKFLTIDQKERFFTKNIHNFIKKGNNFVELRPRTKLDIVEIKVELVE